MLSAFDNDDTEAIGHFESQVGSADSGRSAGNSSGRRSHG